MSTHTPQDGRVSVRLSQKTLDRLERLRGDLAVRDPQLLTLYQLPHPSVSAVTRLAIEIGLNHLEEVPKKTPRKRSSR